jgi:hypothetical protein
MRDLILPSLVRPLVSCLAWTLNHGLLPTGMLVLAASVITLYQYGYLGVVFGWTIAAILLAGLVVWAHIARVIRAAINELLVFGVERR